MNRNTDKPTLEVDTTKRRLLFYHCGSEMEMEQLVERRLAELTNAAKLSRRKEEKRQLNRTKHILSQWLTGWDLSEELRQRLNAARGWRSSELTVPTRVTT